MVRYGTRHARSHFLRGTTDKNGEAGRISTAETWVRDGVFFHAERTRDFSEKKLKFRSEMVQSEAIKRIVWCQISRLSPKM